MIEKLGFIAIGMVFGFVIMYALLRWSIRPEFKSFSGYEGKP